MTNGEEKVFENEKAAEEYYATLYGKYEVREISVKKGLLILSVENITAEIAANNKSFIEEYKKENGVEPSFFKKDLGYENESKITLCIIFDRYFRCMFRYKGESKLCM